MTEKTIVDFAQDALKIDRVQAIEVVGTVRQKLGLQPEIELPLSMEPLIVFMSISQIPFLSREMNISINATAELAPSVSLEMMNSEDTYKEVLSRVI